jgi:hypothetical protein
VTTAWTDDEYGRVARALLYPSSRTFVVTFGFEPDSIPIGWQLDTRIARLNAAAKAEALKLADLINKLRLEMIEASTSCPEVQGVGNIKRDVMAGLRIRRSGIDEALALLETRVDWHRNPNAENAGAAGGMNGTWCP